MTIEAVIWKDAHSVDEWTDVKEICMEPRKIVSVGVVVCETEDAVAVSAGYNLDDHDACATMVIPKVLIVSRRTLEAE